MEPYCQNTYCQNESIKEVLVSAERPSDGVRGLCANCEEVYTWGVQHGKMISQGLKIDPPPKDGGPEPMYRVFYVIDVNAADVRGAAEYVHRIMSDPASMPPVLHVVDSKGNDTVVDMSKD